MAKIKLFNVAKKTSCVVVTNDGYLTPSQVRAARIKLCGSKSCLGGDVAGSLPSQVEEVGPGRFRIKSQDTK